MTLAERLRDNKAVYTMAGAGDLAVEKLREVPEQVTRLQDDFRQNLTRLQGEVRENVTRLQGRVEVRDLPGAAVAYVNHFSTRTVEVIDELAERGKKVVTRVENQAATQELQESAKRTQRRTKAAVGEARKTARAATRAAGDASKKVGD
ncbi:MAG TPA: hypothetical protein VHJ17_03895 [Thermomonospora sp.]|nr:hypothetical protein [Thermomonospora sp.]